MSQEIKTVLNVDASRAAAGFSQGAKAAAGYGAAVQAAGVKADVAATRGISRVGTAAAASSGSVKALGSSMAASAAGATALGSGMTTGAAGAAALGSGMKTAGAATVSANAAVNSTAGTVSRLGSGMAAAGAVATTASGGLKSMGSAATNAGIGATAAGQAVKEYAGSLTTASAQGAQSTNSLRNVGVAAQAAGGSMMALRSGMDASSASTSKAANSMKGVANAASSSNVSIQALSSGGMRGVAVNAETAASGLAGLTGSINTNRAAWDDLSSKAMIGGAVIAGGMGLATKAAIDWESSWAGVAKTVDGTDAQMAELEDGLRGLAKELPATHAELAGVAEAAGQLGVARNDILGFTETAVALGESTNLSAEEAATGLAKMSNIMGTASREGVAGYERMGSALVALGNDGASTESEILDMSLRLAGAGKQIGATEADILAMANALSSVGIEAELGGGAMSRAMLKMNTAVISGGEELEAFAEISGMSATAFAEKWRSDPIAATNAFVGGLGRIGESGGDASAALDSVGLAGTQNAQVLLRAAGSSDLMTKSLKLGGAAWKDNAALQEEAAKRYATDASRLQIATNTMKDAAIDFGSVLGPILAGGAEKVAGLANAFVQLPGPVKSTITGITGVVGAVGLLGGATVKAVGFTQDMSARLTEIGMMTPRVEKGLKGTAAAARGLGIALAATTAVGTIGSMLQDRGEAIGIQKMTEDMLDGADAVTVLNRELKANQAELGLITPEVSSFGDALQVAFDPGAAEKLDGASEKVLSTITLGMGDVTTRSEEASKAFKTIDDQLTGLVEAGNQEYAGQLFKQYAKAANDAGVSTEQLKSKLPGYTEAMASAGNQSKLAGGDIGGMGDEAQSAEEQVEELSDAITGLGDTLLAQSDASIGYQQSLDDLAASLAENGRTLDLNYESGRNNQKALNDLANATQEYAAATLESTGSVAQAEGVLSRGRTQWEKYAAAAGMPASRIKSVGDELFKLPKDTAAKVSAPGAKKAADDVKNVGTSASGAKSKVLGLDTTIKSLTGKKVTVEEAGANASQIRVRELDGRLVGLPSSKKVQVSEIGSTKAGEMVVQFRGKVYSIPAKRTAQIRQEGSENARAKVLGLSASIKLLNGKKVMVGEDGAQNARGRVLKLDGSIFGLKGKTVSVKEIGSDASGNRVVSFRGKIYSLQGKTVSVTDGGSASAAAGAVGGLIGQIGRVPGNKNANVRAWVHGLWDVQAMVQSIANVSDKTVTVRAVTIGAVAGFAGRWAGGIDEHRMAEGGVLGPGRLRPGIYGTSKAGIHMAEDTRSKWEAYIPERMDRRRQSVGITADVAGRLGYDLVPKSRAVPMAQGGMREHAPSQFANRTYVTPAPRVTVAAPAPAGAAPRASMSQSEARMIAKEFASYVGPEFRDALRGKASSDAARVNATQKAGGRTW